MALMAAMVVGSLLSSNAQRNAQMKAQAADAKLQRAKLEKARLRQADDYTVNSQRLREATQRREVEIESNRLDAESGFDEAFAGSGITGSTVDQMDAEINAAVVKNKKENLDSLDQQLGDMARNYQQGVDDINVQSKAINTTAPKQNVLGDIINAATTSAQAMSGLESLSDSFGSLGKKLGFKI